MMWFTELPRLLAALRGGRSCAAFVMDFGGGRLTSGSGVPGLSTHFTQYTYLSVFTSAHQFLRLFIFFALSICTSVLFYVRLEC